MEAAAEIAALEDFAGRAAGTDAERRAANHLRDRLREAEVHPIEVFPRSGLSHALHAVLSVAGSVVSATDATLGAALVAAALASAALDAAGLPSPGRRLAGRRASQNVESREDRGRPGVLVLSAGYDAPRPARLRNAHPILLTAITAVLACCALRLAGVEGTALAAAQFAPTAALIVLLLPLLEPELGPTKPDPAGAAAVALVLELAEELRGSLERFDLWVVLTGASRAGGLGMRRWLRRRRPELAGRRAVVLSIGPVGDGRLRYARRSDPELARICAEIAEDDSDGAYGATPAAKGEPADGRAAHVRRVPALSVWCEGRDRGDLERAAGFCRELIGRLDLRPG